MTDAHCHVSQGDAAVRELLVGRDFLGVHPWEVIAKLHAGGPRSVAAASGCDNYSQFPADLDATERVPPVHGRGLAIASWECLAGSASLEGFEARLRNEPRIGVGEIGLDRLKERDISPQMREVFDRQLALAARFARPVVLHGAKCWGEVVKACRPWSDRIPSFLFHGFSRSDGLIPDIVGLNGYISVGPAVLNDHAVNYRKLVVKIPLNRLLVETDRTEANVATCPTVAEVAAKVAELRGLSLAELERQTDVNADEFIRSLRG